MKIAVMLKELESLEFENLELKSKLLDSESQLEYYRQIFNEKQIKIPTKLEHYCNNVKKDKNSNPKLFFNYEVGSNQVINEITEGPFETSNDNFKGNNTMKRSVNSNNENYSKNLEESNLIQNLKNIFHTNSNEYLLNEIENLVNSSKEIKLYTDFVSKISDLFAKLTDSTVYDKSKKPDLKSLWRWIKNTVQKFRETAMNYEIEKNKVNNVLNSNLNNLSNKQGGYSSLLYRNNNKVENNKTENRSISDNKTRNKVKEKESLSVDNKTLKSNRSKNKVTKNVYQEFCFDLMNKKKINSFISFKEYIKKLLECNENNKNERDKIKKLIHNTNY